MLAEVQFIIFSLTGKYTLYFINVIHEANCDTRAEPQIHVTNG